jgi:hypothetical protein
VAFSEFPVDGFVQVAICLPIPKRQANKTDRGSQFPRRRLLSARPLQRLVEKLFGFSGSRVARAP